MTLLQLLAMYFHQSPLFIDNLVNSTEVVVHFRMNCLKVVSFVLETIDAVRQLILQD